MKNINWKKAIPHIISLIVIILVNAIYFSPQFQGKKLNQVDIISADAKIAEPESYTEETGKLYLWNNGQFSGMPKLLAAPAKNNLIYPLYKVMRLGFGEPAGLFIALMLLYYITLVFLGVNPYLSLIFSVSIGLSTDNLILWSAGHNSKIRTLLFTPGIILGFIYILQRKRYLFGGAILALFLAMSVYTRHPQMTYYVLFILGILALIKTVEFIRKSEWTNLAKAYGVMVLALVLALGSSASKVWSIYDFNKSTMRGDPVLNTEKVSNTEAQSSSEVKGLDWNYAMQWSNGFTDLMASYIPGFAGGGSGEKVDRSSASYKQYNIQQAPLYWGDLPFTEGPIYIGAILIFLFIFGLYYIKGDLKLWLGIALLLVILMSMGKHFAILNKPLFDYLPFYNKFRSPQSIMSAGKFFIPILGALALSKLFLEHHRLKILKNPMPPPGFKRSLLWSAGICGGIALFFALFGPSLFTFQGIGDARYIQAGTDITPFIQDRQALMRQDSFRTFLLVGLTAGLMWFYMKRKIGTVFFLVVLGTLSLFDVWSVGQRYLDHEEFVSPAQYEQNFSRRPVDEQILDMEPRREGYRVLDLTVNTFNDARQARWHNTIGGYSPAKLQRYQDLIEHHLSQNNMNVLNMLNTKYIIASGQNGQPTVQRNPEALGNAWFVDDIRIVDTPNEEIEALTNLDTETTAVVLDKEFDNYVDEFDPTTQEGNQINLTSYEPDHLTYKTNTSSDQFALFSEIWYGPDKGWQAYLDGEPVPFVRANYVLRAMRIPEGEHTIEFVFHPRSYYTGEKISLFSSLFLLGLFVFVGFIQYKNKKRLIDAPDYDLEVKEPVRKKKVRKNAGKTGKPKRKNK